MEHYKVEKQCRSCGSDQIEIILPFGETPLADRLLTKEQLDQPELTAPLTLAFCPDWASRSLIWAGLASYVPGTKQLSSVGFNAVLTRLSCSKLS